jgi:hypothetical protein
MSAEAPDPQADPFRPPDIPTEVGCLHCGREYDSYLIEWRELVTADGSKHWFWCCPTPGCDGKGFGCDIFPTDPDYQDERGGWVWDDDEEEEESADEDFDPPDRGDAAPRPPGDEEDDLPW